jgi:predicted ArsR family transcriptional regulator
MDDFARTHARTDNIDTSHAAAARTESMASKQTAMIHKALDRYGPQTSDEIANRVDLLPHQVIKRVSDLRNSGTVIDSGERRPTRTGRLAAVWRVAPVQLDIIDMLEAGK